MKACLRGRLSILPVSLFTGVLLCLPGSSIAADTVETWDVGATDVDFYLGFNGLGPKRDERAVYGDFMLGYGIVDRFSAYLGTTLRGDEQFSNGQAGIYFGVYGTQVDTDHLDLDLFLNIQAEGAGFSEFQMRPSAELNFDLEPAQRSWGIYLRAGLPVYGHVRPNDSSDPSEHQTTFCVVLNPGTYLTVAEGHQILLEYDMAFHERSVDEHPVDVGGLAIGYNMKINGSIELISQVYLDIPQNDEVVAVGLTIGFIATLPSSR